jgi:hypothetical protein
MATQITKPQVELPSTELPGLDSALASVEQFTLQLAPLQEKARTIEVKFPDKSAYSEIGEVLSEVRNLRKQGAAQFAPFDLIVDRVKTFLRTKRQKHENTCEEIETVCKAKMKPWEQQELEVTQKEETKLNKKAEKRGEAPVEVQPSIPTVAGYRRTTNYYAEVTDADKLLRAWMRAGKEQHQYLRKFITIDVKALNAEAREVKDPEKLQKAIPGIRAWKD